MPDVTCPPNLDHLVVAARTLEEGGAWIESLLGVAPVPGGRHATMGTHNRLLGLGDVTYLEVIAIDPQAPPPARARWFSLDTPAMRARLAQGPALIHWVVRTDAIEEDVRQSKEPLEILAFSRGPYRWRMALPPDGRLPGDGRSPTMIQWEGEQHPAVNLPASGCELVELVTTGHAPRARISAPGGVHWLE